MIDAVEGEPGVWSVIDGTRVYEVRIAREHVIVNGRAIDVAVEDLRGWVCKPATESTGGPLPVRATMPGKVVRILVEVGDSVSSGQGVVVVEAMKMQNELKSPRSGRIVHIGVAPHATVDAGTVLVTIE